MGLLASRVFLKTDISNCIPAIPMVSVSDGSSGAWSEDEASSYKENESTNHGSMGIAESSTGDDRLEVERMIRKESKDVSLWREIVTGMMVITGTLVTVSTFVLFSQLEVQDFSDGFEDDANNVFQATSFKMKTIEESLFGLSDVVTSYANASGKQWPYVTLPDFDIHASHVLKVSGLDSIWACNLVEDSERAAWNIFAANTSPSPGLVYNDIYTLGNGTVFAVDGPGPFAAISQVAPMPTTLMPVVNVPINFDLLSFSGSNEVAKTVEEIDGLVATNIIPSSVDIIRIAYSTDPTVTGPGSLVVYPLHDEHRNGSIVGYLVSIIYWSDLFENILLENQRGIVAVLNNSCGSPLTWEVNGPHATFKGIGNLHDPRYEKYALNTDLQLYESPELAQIAGACVYSLTLYPSTLHRNAYTSNKRQVFTTAIGVIFFGLSATFFLYDKFVQRRNDKVVRAAAKSSKIVSSLFPATVRDQLYAENENEGIKRKNRWLHPKSGISDFLHGENELADDSFMFETKPIADLFPECTIMFADLVGFTAWSSVREPSQVFTLLETVYRAFDQIARRRKIFKVETVGDCYVAVAGLPEPRRDHAIAMSKFAFDCLKKVGEVTKKLEVALGPDTADLTVRVGLHSGPVTAGVLRGEKSRFQLFGDTMNTAARMESTGQPEKIQISHDTADLLLGAGKTHWITQREDKVIAKGKGEMQTFWLNLQSSGSTRSSSENDPSRYDTSNPTGEENDHEHASRENAKVQRLMGDKTSRLINWNVDVLLSLLKQIVARRQAASGFSAPATLSPLVQPSGTTVIDEVTEIITLPEFDQKVAEHIGDAEDTIIDEDVVSELLDYVTNVAIMYNENPFHCFDHASHVCMSVTKLMSRIVAPSHLLGGISADIGGRGRNKLASNLHDHTYGITSDPLTQFACVFSALIHDIDHTGVPNSTLVKENTAIASLYKNKSVAEQNSVDLAWELLTDDSYSKLRDIIYSTEDEQRRFRQLVVNSVMATDIMDKDLKKLRNARWEKAFDPKFLDTKDSINRKATIVIEHLIQASDVAHTMQHWHIYRKWNERLFKENYIAYQAGRADSDPAVTWYEGELGFFDFYIIPLANKLKECGVFGVSSAEYLNYAKVNRQEWEARGRQIVSEMVEEISKKSTPGNATRSTNDANVGGTSGMPTNFDSGVFGRRAW